MADKPAASAPPASAEAAAPAKKGPPIKTIGIVAGLMIAEAVGVVLFVGALGPKPQAAAAHTIEGAEQADLEASVEIPLLEEKFQNMQTGRAWVCKISLCLIFYVF